MSKASAKAHPIQGLVKYHGLRDLEKRIPFHDSISVCTGPIETHTTVALIDGQEDDITIDGVHASGRAAKRAIDVLDFIRAKAASSSKARVVSNNNFPQFVGLGSSSSGFAALAVAAAAAYGWNASASQLSDAARIGAGSASRAVTGAVSEWVVADEAGVSSSRCILPADDLDWEIVVPLVRHEEPTEGVHTEVLTSPLFAARVEAIEETLAAARQACSGRDLHALWALAEKDTLSLHAITMTGDAGHVTWQPATVAVIRAVRSLRADGVPVWFSIDTGATAYLNTDKAHAEQVVAAVENIVGVAEVMRLRPAGPARLVEEHLF